jgi:hypothetical protein
MHKAFDWKRSRISMLEVEAIPQSCIPYVQIGLGILRLSNQYILVRVIPSYFRFAKMCLC